MSGAQADDAGVVTEQPSFLEMSDEDLMKLAPPELAPGADAQDALKEDEADAGAKAPAGDGGADGGQVTDPANPDADDASDEAGDSQAEDGAEGKEAKEPKESKDPKDPGSKDEKDDKKPAAADDAAKDAPVVVDFEAEYKRLLTPFKANGRDIQVSSVDDAIALMQMGANYNKKMAALKPNLKLMKMLENNGLMTEDKIGFLIDLGKKDPGAINKLVKESGLDPMDLDADKASAYKQTSYAVDDREIELDTVLDELQGNPSYTRTLDVVSNKWDVASKQEVSRTPQLLKVINDHVASGIYDLISTEVERERMLGRLNGLSDIQAYRQVGDGINARGGFNHLVKQGPGQTKPAAVVVVPPKPKQVEDDKLKDKRRAASSTQPAAPSATAADFNPLGLSDEEFSKLATPKFS